MFNITLFKIIFRSALQLRENSSKLKENEKIEQSVKSLEEELKSIQNELKDLKQLQFQTQEKLTEKNDSVWVNHEVLQEVQRQKSDLELELRY